MMGTPNRRRARALVAVAAFSLVAAACGDDGDAGADAPDDGAAADNGEAGDPVTLTYAFFAPEVSFPGVQMNEFAERLDEMTETEVTVELFAGGTLLDSGDIFDGVTQGVADIGMDSPAYDTSRFPLSAAINLPLDFANSQAASHTFYDLLTEYGQDEFDGYKIVTAFTTEPAYLQTTFPVSSTGDLSGAELRSAGAGVPSLESLGASPVGMPMPSVGESLQTGVISGYMSSREVLQDFGLAEQVGYWTDYAFGISNSFVAVMTEERFSQLPQDVQDAIDELGEEMMRFASEYHDVENVGEALDWSESEHGVERVELEDGVSDEWDEALEPQIDAWRERNADSLEADEIVDRLMELRDQYNAEYGD